MALRLTFCAVLLVVARTSSEPDEIAPLRHAFQFFDASGSPLADGHVLTYRAGTLTSLETFSDPARKKANSNPIQLNSMGVAPIWLPDGEAARIRVFTKSGALIWDADSVRNLAQLSQTAKRIHSGVGPSLTRIFEISDFGCLPNANHPMNSCLQKAARVITASDKLYFPPGTYTVDNSKGWLAIPAFSGWMDFALRTTVICEDPGFGCLRWVGGTGITVTGLTVEYRVAPPKRVSQVSVFFDGSEGGCIDINVERFVSRNSGAAGLNFYYCHSVRARDIKIFRSQADGLAVNNTVDFSGDGIETEDTGDDAVNCISYEGAGQLGHGCRITNITVRKTKSGCITLGGYRDVAISHFTCDLAVGYRGQNAVIDVRDAAPSVAMGLDGFSISDGIIRNSARTYGIRVASSPRSTGVVRGSFSNIQLTNIYFDFSNGYAIGTDDNNVANRTLNFTNIKIENVQVGSPLASLPAAGVRIAAASVMLRDVTVSGTTGSCVVLKDFQEATVQGVTVSGCSKSGRAEIPPIVIQPSMERRDAAQGAFVIGELRRNIRLLAEQ